MRRQLTLVLLLVAGLLATGSEWDLVQTFAWARMIAGYSRDMTFVQAVEKTFSPRTMCPICRAVAAAERQSAGSPAIPSAKMPGKILLVVAPARVAVFATNFNLAGLLSPPAAPVSAERSAPPSPPPRELA